MADFGVDPGLVNDFLMEAGELVEQLDGDLVALEDAEDKIDLLNSIFRALHTIKGAASFLNMPAVTTFAHAAEDALNKLRKGEAQVTPDVIDALLRSVDVVKAQLAQIEAGEAIEAGPDDLVQELHRIAEGGGGGGAADAGGGAEEAADASAAAPARSAPFGGRSERIEFPPEKQDVLPFMVDDLRAAAEELAEPIDGLTDDATRAGSAERIAELAAGVMATADYFGVEQLTSLVSLLVETGERGGALNADAAGELTPRLRAAMLLVTAAADGLMEGCSFSWPCDTLGERVRTLLNSGEPGADWPRDHGDDAEKILEIDGVSSADAPAPATIDPPAGDATDQPEAPAADAPAQQQQAAGARRAVGGAEQTIRVEVSRLESLLNLVGEMVLTKNQVVGLSRRLQDHELPQDLLESAGGISGDLDRLTSELQVAVMRTRMQPLDKLFGKYPRIIRDLARKTGKSVDLKILGGDTEVDKSVLELLGDPLVHMLRNSVDHGVEAPETRVAAGKPERGTIVLSAEHQGGHVRVAIDDDGKGMDRAMIGGKAVEKGLATEEQVAQMSDSEVFKFIFAAGFSTAAQVSDLSGRGVGMDVVRTNIQKLGGEVHVSSELGKGTTLEILIPLTVAIMPAMMVGVGESDYAVPLSTIVEIIRHDPVACHEVAGRPVMRVREQVLPLIDLRTALEEQPPPDLRGFAVVVAVGQERAGLVVDRLVGQQEVVIKPLDDAYTSGGPFSGATIREDGDVSLILDVVKLLRCASGDAGEPLGCRSAGAAGGSVSRG